jgi:hypothetical protein
MFEKSRSMSKNINVDPDHYDMRGRERQGEDVLHERNTTARSEQVNRLGAQANRQKKRNRDTTGVEFSGRSQRDSKEMPE